MTNLFKSWSSSSRSIPFQFIWPKSLTLSFHCVLLHKSIEHIKIDNDVLECYLTDDRIFHVTKENILRAIGVSTNPEVFQAIHLTAEELQLFLNHISFVWVYKSKEFKNSSVPGPLTIWMHMAMKRLSGKHGGSDSMCMDWIYLVYIIYTRKTNYINLLEVLW